MAHRLPLLLRNRLWAPPAAIFATACATVVTARNATAHNSQVLKSVLLVLMGMPVVGCIEFERPMRNSSSSPAALAVTKPGEAKRQHDLFCSATAGAVAPLIIQ